MKNNCKNRNKTKKSKNFNKFSVNEKTKKERQENRLENRLAFRKERRNRQREKEYEQQVISPMLSGMQLDVSSIVGASEAIENFDQEDELDQDIQNFPELCSQIKCDEFAKVKNDPKMTNTLINFGPKSPKMGQKWVNMCQKWGQIWQKYD